MKTDPYLRAIALLILLLAAGWCAAERSWVVVGVTGVIVVAVLMQWWNERSKR
jgi:hypothetical protein